VLDRFGAGPIDLLRRVVFKTVTGPRRYGTEDGYDAQRFWADRFRKYGTGLRGSGDEGLSEAQNRLAYEQAGAVVLAAVEKRGVELSSAAVLDVGCGPGFFTELLHSAGVASYTGVDITDQLFADLRARFPDYRFEQKDVTSDLVEGTYDVVMMIDVAEHVVTTEAFDRCIANLAKAVAPGGLLLIGPLVDRGAQHLFYVRFWSTMDVLERLPSFEHLENVPFRNGMLTAFRRPQPASR
jgi:2-polyprenyl-3-methyl-5-hydroxy-6-metoxy-1,4-benzoquinol methylase